MAKLKNIKNMVFGRLRVIEMAGRDKHGNITWKCLCECGNEVIVSGCSLRSGNTKSCGCLHSEIVSVTMLSLGDNHPAKLNRLKFSGDNNPAKRPEVRKKMSGKRGKYNLSNKWYYERSLRKNAMLGKHHSPETIERVSGPNSKNWKGGASFGKYCFRFNGNLKERIRAFFNYECVLCGKPQKENITKSGRIFRLSCHHIDYNKQACCNTKIVYFAALCINCHTKTSHNQKQWENILYTIIQEIYNNKSYYTKDEYKAYLNNKC